MTSFITEPNLLYPIQRRKFGLKYDSYRDCGIAAWELRDDSVHLRSVVCPSRGYTYRMQQSALGSFAKSVIGFLLFISLSLGITLGVNYYTASQEQAHQTAAAIQAMLVQKN